MVPKGVHHGLLSCKKDYIFENLRKILNSKEPNLNRTLIFVNDPKRVDLLCEQLLKHGHLVAPLYGLSSKLERKETMDRLRDGRIKIVVATELASRGLDIPEVSHVINYDLPTDSQHYLHRYYFKYVVIKFRS